MTQAQLAEACGLHRTFIGSVERGERNVAILNLRRIAKSLRVSLAELFAGQDEARITFGEISLRYAAAAGSDQT